MRGKPACLSPLLKSARAQWNFTGYVTSDSDAVQDAYETHHYVKTGEEATALALTDGQCDMNSGQTYIHHLDNAVSQGEPRWRRADGAARRSALGPCRALTQPLPVPQACAQSRMWSAL